MDPSELRTSALSKLSNHIVLGELLRPEEIEHFERLFTSLDTNGDGWISREELRHLFVTEAEVDNALRLGDLDGDGGLSFDELTTTAARQKLDTIEQRAWGVFAGFDIDADGIVERDEIRAISDAGPEELAALLEAAIGEGQSEIHYDAFLLWFVKRELAAAETETDSQ